MNLHDISKDYDGLVTVRNLLLLLVKLEIVSMREIASPLLTVIDHSIQIQAGSYFGPTS